MIDVIDYGGGNLGSMERCLQRLGLPFQRVGGQGQPTPNGDNALLFPGVGAFGQAMQALKDRQLIDRIRGMAHDGVPYLGVCIGLQVLFERSEEAPEVAGLGLLPGVIQQFRHGKIPQIGWNHITPTARHADAPQGDVYFVNSYHPVPEEAALTLYEAHYYGPFCAAATHENITAYQFHPEKSGPFGHQLIETWGKRYG